MEKSGIKKTQYYNAQKFNARIILHKKYAVNKRPWPIWLFSQYKFADTAKIIEFGCGNGLLWKANSFRINHNWNITLSDFSEGMIASARENIGDAASNIKYEVLDLSKYITEEKYNNVIANHMLYHLQNRDEAIHTISNILFDEGEFYTSTVGKDDMKEMYNIIMDFTGNNNYAITKRSITDPFSLENGKEQLLESFSHVNIQLYEDALEITDADDLTDYVLSLNNFKPGNIVLEEKDKNGFKDYIQKMIDKDGKIHITKSSGTFIAGKRR